MLLYLVRQHRILIMVGAAFLILVIHTLDDIPLFAQDVPNRVNPVGYWKSVDLVQNIVDFQPGTKKFNGDLFLADFYFYQDGTTSGKYTWDNDQLIHWDGKTKAVFHIREIEGSIYLFLPWLSGDVTVRGMKPVYYVLEKSIVSITEYDDVSGIDVSGFDFTGKEDLPSTLVFNEKTVWPASRDMPPGCNPAALMKAAMNPGLQIRDIHNLGITGKGIYVGIIDQPITSGHHEYTDNIIAYYDTGCGDSKTSYHGPSVISLLAGRNCGTAPDARVFYAAVPSWEKDSAYYAAGLDWIIGRNSMLPPEKKIRVVSVSASPSGPGSPYEKNKELWDEACHRAEEHGILVLDCTGHRGFIGPCYYDLKAPNDLAMCKPGFPGLTGMPPHNLLLVPCSHRTTATENTVGEYSYKYWGQGGLSWSILYCAGVLALGWQVRPGISLTEMKKNLIKSSYSNEDGYHIINPANFITVLREHTR